MKRRKFTQSLLATLGLSVIPLGMSLASQATLEKIQINQSIITTDGLKLSLKQRINPTANNDDRQFIMTYDVENSHTELEEKIYQFKIADGEIHQMYMTPVNDKQLQAVFNWRLNA